MVSTPAAPTTPTTPTAATPPKQSPFHCMLYDEMGRLVEGIRPSTDGRSWSAAMQPSLARQMLEDASRAQSVSRDLLTDALHCLEYESLFGGRQRASQGSSVLDGVWQLRFNAGAAFLDATKDRWGYLLHQEEKPVCLHFDSAASAITVDALHGPAPKSFQGTFVGSGQEGTAVQVDFSRVQLLEKKESTGGAAAAGPLLPPSELPLVNTFLRPGASMHLIHVEDTHLALRYTAPDALESSLLVFSKAPAAAVAAAAAKVAAATAAAAASSQQKKKKVASPAAALTIPKFNKKDISRAQSNQAPRFVPAPEKGAPKKMQGEYASMWDYFAEESKSLYLVLTFPTFVKHAPHFLETARFKFLLLQELVAKALEVVGQHHV